jgi:hypothetical protein
MPLEDVGMHVLALLVYPGALLALGVGLAAEAAVTAVAGAGLRAGLVGAVDHLRTGLLRAPTLLVGGMLLATLAATQLAAPLNPVPPPERGLLVAAVALASVTWLAWGWGWETRGARLVLVLQGCWLLAVVGPALVSQTLRPQALGAVIVPSALPLKASAAVLYLVCLPSLLQLVPGMAPGQGGRRQGDAAAARVLLWLPYCGLFASLFVPPLPEDLGGAVRFLAVTLAAGAVAIGLGALLAGRRAPGVFLMRAAAAAAAVVLVAAIATAVLT